MSFAPGPVWHQWLLSTSDHWIAHWVCQGKVVVVVCCHDESVLLEIECFFQLFTVSPKQSYLRMRSAKQMPKAVVTEENAFRRQAHCSNWLAGQATDGAKLALEWGLAAGRADQFGSLFLLLFCFLLRCQCQLKKEFLPVAGSTNDSTGTKNFSTRITYFSNTDSEKTWKVARWLFGISAINSMITTWKDSLFGHMQWM